MAAAPSSSVATQVIHGLLRYQSNSSVLATPSAANPAISQGQTQQHEVQQYWPSEDVADAWKPELSADFNADGQIDVLGFDDSNAWLQVNTTHEFYLIPWGDDLPFGSEVVGLGDVNGDDLTDIVSFNDQTNEVWVSVNSLTHGFQNQLWTRWSESLSTRPFVADFDQDGLTDILVGTLQGRWLLGQSSGTSFTAKDWGSYSVFDWQDMVSGDFNGDGRVDLAARAPDRTWWVWQSNAPNDEPGMDGAKYWGHWKMGTGWTDIRVADFNADGKDDILGRSAEGTLHVATAVETASATGPSTEFHSWRWVTGWVTGADWRNITVVDVTQDGLPDIVGQAKDGTWWVAENIDENFRNFFLDRTTSSIDHVTVARQVPSPELSQLFPDQTDAETIPNLEASLTSPLRVYLKGDGHLVVEGHGQQVNAIEFLSPSGALIPIRTFGTSGFNQLNRNEQVSIRLGAAKPVTIEGELVLGVKWNLEKDSNDLEVIYDAVNVPAIIDTNSFGSTNNEQSEIDVNTEPGASPTNQTLLEQYLTNYPQAVVTLERDLTESREDKPDEDESDETEVAASSVDQPDDALVESASEPETSTPDDNTNVPVVVGKPTVEEDGETEPSEPEPDTVLDEPAPVELNLDENNQFLLTSDLPIFALRIESPTEGLVAGTLAEPFDTVVVADSGLVFYASETPVSGESIPLDVRWNDTETTDKVFAEFGNADSQWQPVFLFGERIAVRSESEDPATEELESERTALSVRLNASGQFVIAANQQVLAVNFRSVNEGLVPGSSPAPFELFVANSQSQITLGTFGRLVTFDGEVTLDIGWNEEIATDELVIELGDEDGQVVRLQSDCIDTICTWTL